jgi:hypothetical protein
MLIFASFYLLSVTGIFFNINTSSFGDTTSFTSIVGASLILGFVVAIGVGILLTTFGVNPYVTAGMNGFISLFAGCYTALMSLLTFIAASFGPEFLTVMTAIDIVLTFVFIFLSYYALIQMSTGGAKGYE